MITHMCASAQIANYIHRRDAESAELGPFFQSLRPLCLCSEVWVITKGEEPRPVAGVSSKERSRCELRSRGSCRPQTPAGHSSPVTDRGILAFSRESLDNVLFLDYNGVD